MEWQVQGADKTTGEARGVKVTGKTQDEAEQRARAFGILASSCAPLEIPADDQYRPPHTNLKRDASRVRFWATVLGVLGALGVILGAILLIVGLTGGDRVDPALLMPGAVSIVNGGVLLAASALMSLFASMGDALRDIARKG